MSIIRSKYEQDVYTFNHALVLMTKFPNLRVRLKFKNRTPGEKVDKKFLEDMKMEFTKLRMLKVSEEMKNKAAKKMWWIPLWFHNWYKDADIFLPEAIYPSIDENDEFQCYAEDFGWRAVFWEINVLPIYAELRNRLYGYSMTEAQKSEALDLLMDQIELSNKNQLRFSEFGLRRRFSAVWQDTVDDILVEKAKYYMGNSSVYQAIRSNKPATGTMAHLIFMIYNAIYGYRFGNRMCVKDWLEVFNGNSGTLLGDTIGIDMFLESVDPLDLKASSSYRHDSGPWETATTKYIRKLVDCGIDPHQKYIVYSNSINMYDLNDIVNNVRGRVQDGVGGIGGAWTNNIPSLPKANPQIVMKLDAIQLKPGGPWINCIKNPDEPGKAMGDPVEIAYCNHVKETMVG